MDACRIAPVAEGWTIEGAAVFAEDKNAVAKLSYRMLCESDWRTREADVGGWIGGRTWRFE